MVLKGHGKLHDIYASIEKSCQIQGWDGVDLLIIGGDFQVYLLLNSILGLDELMMKISGSPQCS